MPATPPSVTISIRWKLLAVMTAYVVILWGTLAIFHTYEQRGIMNGWLSRSESMQKIVLADRGQMLAQDFRRQAEGEIAAYNFSGISEMLQRAVQTYPGLTYVILMDEQRTAFVHTLQPDLERSILSQPQDVFAASQTNAASHEYGKSADAVMEFIEPIRFGGQLWGMLRLGFSLAPLSQELDLMRAEMRGRERALLGRYARVSALFLAVGAAALLLLSSRLTNPLKRLTASALEVARGDFTAASKIRVDSNDEVGALSQAFVHMTRDLKTSYSKLERTVEETRRAEAFLDSVFENLPDMVFVKDAKDLRFIRFNRAGEDLLGYTRAALIGKNDYDFFERGQADQFTAMDREVLRSGHIMDIPEEQIATRQKGLRYLHTKKIPILDSYDAPQYLLGISEDITEWKQTQEALRSSEMRLKDILDNSPAVIYLKDREGRYIFANRRYESLFHVRHEEIVGKTDHDLFSKELADAFRANDMKVQETAAPIEVEEIAPHDDGPHPYISIKFPLFDAQGELYAVCGISTDLTDWKKAQAAIRASEERYRALFDNIPVMYFTLDTHGVVRAVNRYGLEHLGYSAEDLVGDSVLKVFHPDDRADVVANLQRCLKTPAQVANWQFRKICKNGTVIWVQEAVRAVKNAAGETVVLVACEDVTERRKLEQEIVQATATEQERFARDLHDGIGQILTGLAFKCKLMERSLDEGVTPPTERAQEIVKLANQASEQARALARGLDPVALREGLPQALRELAHSTQEMLGVQCSFATGGAAAAMDKLVATHLYRIAQESVNNAVRHGHARAISIALTSSSGLTSLTISDDGTGMPAGSEKAPGLGIRSMKYRARMVGAALSIIANEQGGTTVICTLHAQRPVAGGTPDT